MSYTRKLLTNSGFFKKKEDTSGIDSTFNFLEPEKQNNLPNSNGTHIEINLSKFPTIETSQFNILNKSGMVGYQYIHDTISKSQVHKHLEQQKKLMKHVDIKYLN